MDNKASLYRELDGMDEAEVRGLNDERNWGGNTPVVQAWLYRKEMERQKVALDTALAAARASRDAARWAMWAAIATAVAAVASWVQILVRQ
ncbi:hypothetical protein GCT13_08445 [Paraburkholderia sp. CNPSo 3157]|uniref:Uncharacterized protein n=1 Tax=Paraburkholderia franconis TaxID=2654983 RepID=A0A7X1N806_9BURK|nr:hypothetical protein [Paraburkholderia franconis]MPW16960.1 hypothetical protein [Paraburkholderia franconis]